MLRGEVFPPVVVFANEEGCWLADGWHRYGGAERAGLTEIEVIRHPGGVRDAILFALGANATNGLRRSNADKRRAVTVMLEDPEWSLWSNREIARRCGVDEQLARRLRTDLTAVFPQSDTPRTYTTKHGTIATMNVARIGRDRDTEDQPGPVVEEPYRITPARETALPWESNIITLGDYA